MLPAITIASPTPPPPTLVATVLPGNNTLRVNADNVPPAVSNVEINNNNRGGGAAVAAAAQAPTAAAANAPAGFSLSPFIYVTPTSLGVPAQTGFFAQLMSQDPSAQTSRVLVEYEQMVARSQVKYKPSDATRPEPEPASLFGKFLQQERGAAATPQPQQIETAAAATPAPKPAGAARSEPSAKAELKMNVPAKTAAGVALHAYRAMSARNDAAAKPEAVEEAPII